MRKCIMAAFLAVTVVAIGGGVFAADSATSAVASNYVPSYQDWQVVAGFDNDRVKVVMLGFPVLSDGSLGPLQLTSGTSSELLPVFRTPTIINENDSRVFLREIKKKKEFFQPANPRAAGSRGKTIYPGRWSVYCAYYNEDQKQWELLCQGYNDQNVGWQHVVVPDFVGLHSGSPLLPKDGVPAEWIVSRAESGVGMTISLAPKNAECGVYRVIKARLSGPNDESEVEVTYQRPGSNYSEKCLLPWVLFNGKLPPPESQLVVLQGNDGGTSVIVVPSRPR